MSIKYHDTNVGVTLGGGGKLPIEVLYNPDFKLNTTGQTFWDGSNSGTSANSRINIVDGWNIMQCTAEIESGGLRIVPAKTNAYLTCSIPAYWFIGKNVQISAIINGVQYTQTGIMASYGFSVTITAPFGQMYLYAYSASDIVFSLYFKNVIGSVFLVSETSMQLIS